MLVGTILTAFTDFVIDRRFVLAAGVADSSHSGDADIARRR